MSALTSPQRLQHHSLLEDLPSRRVVDLSLLAEPDPRLGPSFANVHLVAPKRPRPLDLLRRIPDEPLEGGNATGESGEVLGVDGLDGFDVGLCKRRKSQVSVRSQRGREKGEENVLILVLITPWTV
jgi:hypothetical protein